MIDAVVLELSKCGTKLDLVAVLEVRIVSGPIPPVGRGIFVEFFSGPDELKGGVIDDVLCVSPVFSVIKGVLDGFWLVKDVLGGLEDIFKVVEEDDSKCGTNVDLGVDSDIVVVCKMIFLLLKFRRKEL